MTCFTEASPRGTLSAAFSSPTMSKYEVRAWRTDSCTSTSRDSRGDETANSLAVEANGNICVASLVYGGITVVAANGRFVEFVSMPDPFCTNICFGGPDLETAYITLSGSGRLVSLPWLRKGLALNYSHYS